MSLTEDIKQEALDIGFDLVGVTDASPIDGSHAGHFLQWLDAGYAGQMSFLHMQIEKRLNPAGLLNGAESLIIVGLNYKPSVQYPSPVGASVGRVAAYAQYDDYHGYMKRNLRKLTDFLVSAVGPGLRFRICVDSVPLLERAFAARAGLGFIGRNHMLIHPELGPQIFLGELITNIKLDSDKPISRGCGDCCRCIAACPTGALLDDGRMDAARCISYLTIECKEPVSPDIAPKIGNHIFGCSECILVCPYYRSAPVCANTSFRFYPDRAALSIDETLAMTDGQFVERFADSPILRPGLEQLKRNARICLCNSGDNQPGLRP